MKQNFISPICDVVFGVCPFHLKRLIYTAPGGLVRYSVGMAIILSAIILLIHPVNAQISVSPVGYFAAVEEQDNLNVN